MPHCPNSSINSWAICQVLLAANRHPIHRLLSSLVLPLGALPYPRAAALWFLFEVVCVLLAVYLLLHRWCIRPAWILAVLGALWLFALTPFMKEFGSWPTNDRLTRLNGGRVVGHLTPTGLSGRRSAGLCNRPKIDRLAACDPVGAAPQLARNRGGRCNHHRGQPGGRLGHGV